MEDSITHANAGSKNVQKPMGFEKRYGFLYDKVDRFVILGSFSG